MDLKLLKPGVWYSPKEDAIIEVRKLGNGIHSFKYGERQSVFGRLIGTGTEVFLGDL